MLFLQAQVPGVCVWGGPACRRAGQSPTLGGWVGQAPGAGPRAAWGRGRAPAGQGLDALGSQRVHSGRPGPKSHPSPLPPHGLPNCQEIWESGALTTSLSPWDPGPPPTEKLWGDHAQPRGRRLTSRQPVVCFVFILFQMRVGKDFCLALCFLIVL